MRNIPRLEGVYLSELRDKMMKRFDYDNVNRVPRVTKVVVNMGLGREAMDNANNLKNAAEQLSAITGQIMVSMVYMCPHTW